MSNRIVLALGGNAILTDDATAAAQRRALYRTSTQLCELVKRGHELVISHGNGPQVGNLYLQQKAGESGKHPAMPMDTCVAMTQGSIGYWLQNAFYEALDRMGLHKNVVSLVTQVEVDERDQAFHHPTKPIGPFLTKEEAEEAMAREGGHYVEDSGRGWRKVVPSPKPVNIVEFPAVRQLIGRDNIVICGGGGGIPVVRSEAGYRGTEAVIDKDLAAEKLAELVDADLLLILTGVDRVCINYRKPDQKELTAVTTGQLKRYIAQKQFPEGSMLPKIQAAIRFVESGHRKKAIITSIDQLAGVGEGAGTEIIAS